MVRGLRDCTGSRTGSHNWTPEQTTEWMTDSFSRLPSNRELQNCTIICDHVSDSYARPSIVRYVNMPDVTSTMGSNADNF